MFKIQSMMANGTRLRAMDVLASRIMLADARLNITYLNKAVHDLLKEAEGDLKKELPQFSVDKLLGSSIDIFHKNPQHQRSMLEKLKTPHQATIYIGARAFDLLVTPLMRGERTEGFVVEWGNARERLLNLDYQARIEAISRTQAVIEFSPEGTILRANDNFLTTFGYDAQELVGKPHRMLVDADYAQSQSYATFWKNLGSGLPEAGEFQRNGKNGKRVTIQASYNPIAGPDGKVQRVVKYATDVTRRVDAVRAIGQALTQLSSGDLSFTITEPFTPEFEDLRQNFNSAATTLNVAMNAVQTSSDQIENGAHEISSAADDLARRTEQQAASLEQTAAALDEITSNVSNSSHRAEEAQRVAVEANASAAHSGKIVAEAVGAMARIENSSNQIANIIGVIDEIAFQTNLLALNAGVEAARAGEAGKGFAVVAQEVRELAQRSAAAAKEIKTLIQNSSTEVQAGVKLVRETGKALEEIGGHIVTVNDHMAAIVVASREQAQGLREVNTAVNQMDQMTQQNAAMVEESNAASASLASEADRLKGLIRQFRLDEPSRRGMGSAPRRVA